MTDHPELELLSVYVDGELDPPDRERLEAHVPSCAECAATLDALRATLADLALLASPEPSEQESWALRAFLERERRRPGRTAHGIARWAPAIAVAAVALVSVVTIVSRPHPAADKGTAAAGGPQELSLAQAPPIMDSQIDYDESTIALRLNDLAVDAYAAAGTGDTTGAPSAVPGAEAITRNSTAADSVGPGATAGLEVCLAKIPGYKDLSPILYEVAAFKGKPAYVIGLRASDRIEIWVFAQDGCTPLYFLQRPAS